MSNILNLLTASILAVSPIVSQPKMVERPTDTILYEQTEFLDNGLIISSFIVEYVDEGYDFLINVEDNKLIDLSYRIFVDNVSNSNFLELSINGYDNFNDYELFYSDCDIPFTDLSDLVEDFLNYENEFDISFNSSDNILSFTFYYFTYEDDLLALAGNTGEVILTADSPYYHYYDYYSSNYSDDFIYNYLDNTLYNKFLKTYVLELDNGSLLSNIFDTITFTIEDYVNLVVNLFSQVLALFIVNGELTILGILLIFTFGIGVVKFGFEFIKSLLRL